MTANLFYTLDGHADGGACPGSRARAVTAKFAQNVGLLKRLAGKVKNKK
jgi:hypothetical protein